MDHLVRQAQFLHDHQSSPKEVICSIAKTLPVDRGGVFHETLARHLADLLSEKGVPLPPTRTPHLPSLSPRFIQAMLVSRLRCTHHPLSSSKGLKKKAPSIPLDTAGMPLSKNVVWNACVRQKELSVDLLRENPDRFEHRQRRMRKNIPWSCRDYHRGSDGWWIYPKLPNTRLLFTRNGHYLGAKSE